MLNYKEAVSAKHKRLLARASSLASTSDTCNQKHGAIITKGGSVLGFGINKNKTDPRLLEEGSYRKSSVHAEIAAVHNTRRADLKGATIYVARVNKDGEQMMSKPCEECQQTLKALGIKKVYYTIDNSMKL